MESPILSPDIITLGKKLAAEFARHERTSPMIKWAAQYLAELIYRAEHITDEAQKQVAEKDAMDLILKLWRNREILPYRVRPLHNLNDALDVLLALKKEDPTEPYWQRERNLEQSSPWGKFIAQMRDDNQTIFKITACLVLGGDLLKKEKEWAEIPGTLNAEENKLIEDLDWLVSDYSTSALISITKEIGDFDQPEAPNDRINKSFDKMEKLLQEQLRTIAVLKKSMTG